MKTLWMSFVMLLMPMWCFAQDAAEPPAEPIQLGKYIAMLITGVLVPLAVEGLKKVMPKLPQAVKVILSLVAGAALGFATTALSNWLGVPVDLSALEAVLTGAGLGGIAAVGYGVKNYKVG